MATQDSKLIADKRSGQLKKTVMLRTELLIGASGAITSQTAYKDSGIIAVKTDSETGRYTLSINRGYGTIERKGYSLTVGDDAALTTAAGNWCTFRDNDIGVGAKDGTIELQCHRTDTGADANPTDGTKIEVWLEVQVGT